VASSGSGDFGLWIAAQPLWRVAEAGGANFGFWILNFGWGIAAEPLWRSSYALRGSGGTGKDEVGSQKFEVRRKKNFGWWILGFGFWLNGALRLNLGAARRSAPTL
jgi:hypothetical protein